MVGDAWDAFFDGVYDSLVKYVSYSIDNLVSDMCGGRSPKAIFWALCLFSAVTVCSWLADAPRMRCLMFVVGRHGVLLVGRCSADVVPYLCFVSITIFPG
jgi:hypothetical protein